MCEKKLDIISVSLIYFFVIVIFEAMPILNFSTILTSIIRISIFAFIWVYFFLKFIKDGSKKINKKLLVLLIVYMIVQLFIVFYNDGLGGFSKTNLTLIFFPISSIILYYVFCRDYVLHENRFLSFCYIYSVFIMYACVYNLIFNFETFKNIFNLKSSYDLQFTSFLNNRNPYGLILMIGLFLMTIGILKDKGKKKIWMIFITVTMFNLIFTFSRSAILCSAIFILVFVILNKDIRRKILYHKKIIIFLIIFTVILFAVPPTRNYIMNNIIRLQGGLTNRGSLYSYGIDLYKNNNLLIGSGYTKPYIDLAMHFEYIGFHNTFLTVIICQGIVGLLFYLILLTYSFVNMIKLRKYNNFYGSIFIAIFVSYIVYSFFESRNLFSLEFINYMLTLLICIIPMYLLNNYKVKEKYFFNNQIDFNKDLISIIIPVYNVSAFLDRCLTSVCNQSYKNIEVIIVNDGSTDNSRDICEKFVKKDKRFKLYNRENSGVCTARNYGYKKSHGKYIYFFDGDDYLDENTIKVLYDLMITNNVDVSMVGYYYTFENYEKSNENKYNCKYVLNKKDLLNNIIYRGSYAGYTWNKMYKRKLIGNLKFDEKIAYREDMLYNSFYIERVSRGVYYTSPYYHYVQRDSSVVHQRGFNTKLMGHIYSLEQIRENYLKENLNPLIIDYEIIKCCFNFKYRISVSSDSYFKELREINRICKKYYRKIMSNPKLSKLKRYEIILTNKYPEIICNIKMKLFKIWRFLYE